MPTNEYFDNATLTALPKGQKARAESVDAKFDSITVGFDKLPTEAQANAGTRNYALAGGAANAYTLALSHVTAYSDGLGVQFRIDTGDANTGASTLNVNSVGDAQIVYPDNTALIAADLPVGSVASVRYSTALAKWVIQSVTQGNVNAAAASASAAATSESNAGTSESNASTSASNAATSAALAEDWAAEVEDTVVDGGPFFSALHYAAKAAATLAAAVTLTGTQIISGAKTFTAAAGLIVSGDNPVLKLNRGAGLTINKIQFTDASLVEESSIEQSNGTTLNIKNGGNTFGFTAAGFFTLPQEPTTDTHAVTKAYVDKDVAITSNTTSLEDVTHAINTTDKRTGLMVYNTTTNKPVWADGTTAGSVWVDATGATAHTPV